MSAPGPPPFGYGAYDPPVSQPGRPTVILWYRTYAAATAVLFGALAVMVYRSFAQAGGEYFVAASVAALLHAIGAVVPHKPWGWTYAFLLLLLGCFSCLLPFSIGLVLYWREPTTRAAFQRFF